MLHFPHGNLPPNSSQISIEGSEQQLYDVCSLNVRRTDSGVQLVRSILQVIVVMEVEGFHQLLKEETGYP